eukprot:654882-Prorocentrum_minimum.AAC.1
MTPFWSIGQPRFGTCRRKRGYTLTTDKSDAGHTTLGGGSRSDTFTRTRPAAGICPLPSPDWFAGEYIFPRRVWPDFVRLDAEQSGAELPPAGPG